MKKSTNLQNSARLSVAPMMDWTDRHCRFFHRQMSREALLYTEMVTAPALVRGGALHLLEFNDAEHPVALQLGGSDPAELAEATRIGADYGYDEINLNVGCPSDRVQSGTFGAVLMKSPDLVAECVSAMVSASPVDVTVKCRIGVDDQDPREILPAFLSRVSAAGVRRVTIHARKAWLKGLSPKENREVPPLDYGLVADMKRDFPELWIGINGGITTLDEATGFLKAGLDGVMIGRAAYHAPNTVLLEADRQIFNSDRIVSPETVIYAMLPYIEEHLTAGGRLHQITRHMLGLFSGQPGARLWRRRLSDAAALRTSGPELIEAALNEIAPLRAA